MTRVLYDNRWTEGGIGRFSRSLLGRLDGDLKVETLDDPIHIVDPRSPVKLSVAIRKRRPDVFFTPGFMPPGACPVPFLFTMHDLIHVHAVGGIRRLYYQAIIRPLARRAHKIVTVSEFSRAEICAWTGLSEERVAVIYNGVSSDFSPRGEAFDAGFPYLLYVGARKDNKNLPRMLEAYASSGLRGSCRLLLSGEPNGEAAEALIRLASKLGIGDELRFTGFIPNAVLPSYYRGARALVMVSTYEGFGLPVVEAMASGTPVLCSGTTSLGEVAGDAALRVEPTDVEQIADGMRRIVSDEDVRASLRARGLERAKLFNWDTSASKLSGLLRGAVPSAH